MFRTLVLAAAIGSFAVPALAASVTVNVSGLDAKAAHAKIVQAASTACTAAFSDDASVIAYYNHTDCVTEAAAKAEAQVQAKADAGQRVAKL